MIVAQGSTAVFLDQHIINFFQESLEIAAIIKANCRQIKKRSSFSYLTGGFSFYVIQSDG
jgi:hypothetical protein